MPQGVRAGVRAGEACTRPAGWRGWCALVAALAASCGGTEEAPPREGPTEEVAPAEPDSLVMPDFPEARAGYLVAVSDGRYMLDGAWEARADWCLEPAMVQVVALARGAGTLLVFDVLEASDPVGEYPVVAPAEDGSVAVAAPFARVAAQTLEETRAWAFQGQEGTAELTAFGDGSVSGRFAVTLREVQSNDPETYAGVFERIPVARSPEGTCPILDPEAERGDSLARDPLPIRVPIRR